MKNFFLILLITACSCNCFGQTDSVNKAESTRTRLIGPPDTVPGRVIKKVADSSIPKTQDSLRQNKRIHPTNALRDSLVADSLTKVAKPTAALPGIDTATYKKYQSHSYLPLGKQPVFMIIDYHKLSSKDDLFYLMAGVILFLAFTRAVFSKYFRNLFLLFFQTSLRQKQTREQLLQNNLASLFINLLFFISTGLYISLLIKYKNWAPFSFWLLALYCGVVLTLIYLIKYLFLLFAGWVFNTKEAAGSYIFLVFLVNKVLGVLLIPFLLILSFAEPGVVDVSITVSIGLIGLMYLYRYLVSFSAIRNKLKVNALHFFLYLCAVEVLPLLLIYKGLINYIAGSF